MQGQSLWSHPCRSPLPISHPLEFKYFPQISLIYCQNAIIIHTAITKLCTRVSMIVHHCLQEGKGVLKQVPDRRAVSVCLQYLTGWLGRRLSPGCGEGFPCLQSTGTSVPQTIMLCHGIKNNLHFIVLSAFISDCIVSLSIIKTSCF